MAEKHPFENILEQIADLLKFTEENKSRLYSPKEKPIVLTPDIEAKLQAAQNTLDLFKKVTDTAIQQSNLDEQTIQNNIRAVPDRFNIKDKKILERAKKMRSEVETMEKDFSVWISLSKMHQKKTKTAGKKRAKKFKRLGGQGWMPM